MNANLAELRALLSRAPTPQRWESLCRLFSETWDNQEEKEMAVAYAVEHIRAWSTDIRTLSPLDKPWQWDISEKEEAKTLYSDWQKVLLQTFAFRTREQLFDFLETPYQTSIWGLELWDVQLEEGDFLKLATSSIGKQLRHLRFREGNWDEHIEEFATSGLLQKQLESVGFIGLNGCWLDGVYALAHEKKLFKHLKQLELSDGWMTRDRLARDLSCENKRLLSKLETLYVSNIFDYESLELFLIGMDHGIFPALKHFFMRKHNGRIITPHRFESTPMMFFTPPKTVTSLDVSHTVFSESGFSYIDHQLTYKWKGKLERLDISNIKVELPSNYDDEREEFEYNGDGGEADNNEQMAPLFTSAVLGKCRFLGIAENGLKAKTVAKITKSKKVLSKFEILRIGLVQEVLPPEQLHERAFAMAETIASQAPLGVQAPLASAQQVRLGHVEGAINALIPQARTLMASEDAKEGLHSFLERRDAVFQGK